MSDLPAKSPHQELQEALGVLERLAATHAQGAVLGRAKFFLSAIEADLDYAINPEQMIANFAHS